MDALERIVMHFAGQDSGFLIVMGYERGYFVRLERNVDNVVGQFAYGEPGQSLESICQRLLDRLATEGLLTSATKP